MAAHGLSLTIVIGAVRLVRRDPALIATWTVLLFAAGLATGLLMRPMMLAMLDQRRSSAMPTPDAGSLVPVMLAYLLSGICIVMMLNGALRAARTPDARRWAYLRLGRDELRMTGLALILGVAGYAASVVASVAVLLVLTLVIGTVFGAAVVPVMVMLTMAVVIGAACYFAARLAPAWPLTLERRRIVLRPAWALTRGRGWAVAGGLALVMSIAMAISLLPVPLLMASGWPSPATSPADPVANAAAVAAFVDMATGFGWRGMVLRVIGALAAR